MKPFGEIEWEKRRPDARDPYIVKRVTWSWLTAELVQIRPTELEYRVKADVAYLALHDFLRADGETIIDGKIRSTLLDIQDTLTFVPAGSSVEGWNRFKSRTSSVVAVHLSHLASASKATDISEIPPSLYFENESLRATLLKLRSVLDGSSINDPAYAETLGLLLLWELRHAANPLRSQTESVKGGLTARQLRRITEFIDSQISSDITISDLAALVGLSQFHFIRAFKESAGLSPYQHVLSKRVGRARELLSDRNLSLSDVNRRSNLTPYRRPILTPSSGGFWR